MRLTALSKNPGGPSRTLIRAFVSSIIFLMDSPFRPMKLPTLCRGINTLKTFSPGHPGHLFPSSWADSCICVGCNSSGTSTSSCFNCKSSGASPPSSFCKSSSAIQLIIWAEPNSEIDSYLCPTKNRIEKNMMSTRPTNFF